MNVILGPWFKTEFLPTTARATIATTPAPLWFRSRHPLARARNYEVGIRSKPWGSDGVELIATLWALDLKQELVFVGDEGRRKYVARHADAGWKFPRVGSSGAAVFQRQRDVDQGGIHERGCDSAGPEVTAYGALLLRWPEGLTSQIQATYLGVRPWSKIAVRRRHPGLHSTCRSGTSFR